MKKAIIFDMDGLMIDSERLTYEVYKETVISLGYEFTEEFYILSLGLSKEDELNLYYKKYGDDFPVDLFWESAHITLDNRLFSEVPVKKGLIELLTYLKENHYKTIVATSSQRSRVDHILENSGLSSFFDDVICGDEVTHSKPDPEIFLTACKKLNVDPNDVLVLEDSEAGIAAAHAGNIDVICIPDMKVPGPEFSNIPIKILNNLKDVIDYLRNDSN